MRCRCFSALRAAAVWNSAAQSRTEPVSLVRFLGDAGESHRRLPRLVRLSGVAKTGRPLFRLAAAGRARHTSAEELLKQSLLRATQRELSFSRPQTRPILRSWRKAPTDLARRRGAIQRSIRKKTRRNRRAPKRHGRMRRRSIRRWPICSILRSAKAARESGRRQGLSARPDLLPPLLGGERSAARATAKAKAAE